MPDLSAQPGSGFAVGAGFRRALLTGANGFVGRHLARRLIADGVSTYALVHSGADDSTLRNLGINSKRHDGDTGSLSRWLKDVCPDIVFHLGALYVAEHQESDVAALVDANVLLGCQLMEAMVAAGTKLLVAAGSAWQCRSNEDAAPVNLYAATKSAFDSLIDYYVSAHEVRAVTLRLYDSFGPEDSRGKLLSQLCQAAADGRKIALSAGAQIMFPVHIDDVVAAFLVSANTAAQWPEGGHATYAAAGPEGICLRDLVNLLEQLSGRSIAVEWGARPYRRRVVMRPWLGQPPPGWAPRVSLRDGLMSLLRDLVCSN
jgi:nucleoside-diphosphate-sugar epimerase